MTPDRYGDDVLVPGWRQARRPQVVDQPATPGLVVEVDADGFCGAIIGLERGFVVLEDRHKARRSFRLGPGFHLEGHPVRLVAPPCVTPPPARTASGSRTSGEASHKDASVALPSRIWVEGRHDAELVEKIWGDDLRHVGVVVEPIGGIDHLVEAVAAFRPARGRRLGVLVDHLVGASKERRIAARISSDGYGEAVLIAGHRFVDVWQAIRPETLGLAAWPAVPKGVDIKVGTLAGLGWPYRDQADIARAWQAILARVTTYRDLDPDFVRTVELLVDFVTQDHPAQNR